MSYSNKRQILLCGHYGSGKTTVALNLALALHQAGEAVSLADLDIVNPYFRSKDREALLTENSIRLICSAYAGSNVDIPSLPSDLYVITDDRSRRVVLDIGGDERGALVLGRLTPGILEENDYDMLAVINAYRPLTPDVPSTVEVLREIEQAGGLRFTGLINNSHLGRETTAETVLASREYAAAVSRETGLPVVATTVREDLFAAVCDQLPHPVPLTVWEQIPD